MKIFYFFLFNLFYISYSSENFFNPLPKGNGKYNAQYSHNNNTNNLFFIFEHFRHGARSPCTRPLYNGKDLLGAKWSAVGELSEVGRKQHYLLGTKNRKRYNGFIKEKFDPQEILIFSTHFNRTIMSAMSHLLGFYNKIKISDDFSFDVTIDNDIYSEIKNIIPPIHLFEKKNDEFDNDEFVPTFKTHFNCPYMHEMFIKNLKNKKHKIYELLRKFNKEYYKIIKKEYGITNTTKYTGLSDFCDAIICDYFHKDNIKFLNQFIIHGKSLEKLVNSCYEYLAEHFFGLLQSENTKDHGVITMSNTMKKIVYWMQKRLNEKQNYISYEAPKYVMFSGHDDTMTSMQRFLKTAFNIEFEFPVFASNQIYELRKYGNEFYVELYYNDKLKMNITFELFAKRISEIALDKNEIHNKCYRHKKYFPSHLNKNIIFLGIIFLLFLGVYIYVTIHYFYNNCDDSTPQTIEIV